MNSQLEQSKNNAKAFYDLMFNQCRQHEAIETYVGDIYVQHNPEVADVAKETGSDPASVLDAYGRLAAQRLLVLEDDRFSIRMASPFSGVPTQHVVQSSGVQ